MATQATTEKHEERYQHRDAAKIQSAISSLSELEVQLDDLSSQVGELKRKLLIFAETEAEKARAETIEAANREARAALDLVRTAAEKEADEIIRKGIKETEALKQRVGGNISKAVDLIVKAVQSTA